MQRRHLMGAAFAAATACAGLIGTSTAHAQEPVTLRYATFLPPGGLFTAPDGVMGRWARSVEEASGGLVKIQILPGGTLGAAGRNPGAQLKLVTDGIADIAFVIPSTTPGRFPDDNLFGLPVTESAAEGSLTFWKLHEQGLMRGYDDKSFYIIGLLVNPPNVLHTKGPVKKVEDLRGLRLQASGAEQQELVRALGATPVGTVSVREAAEAISRGVVDGTPKDWLALHSFRIADAAANHVNIPMGASTIMFALNRAKYDSLPPKAREAIDRFSGEPFVRLAGKMFDEYTDAKYKVTMDDKQRSVVTLPPGERARWDKAMGTVVEQWRQRDTANERLWQAFTTTRTKVRGELGMK
ncbi:MAG: TRAP transporter substrate-binding protein [Hydrogenophaga sp.]|uniref:TRAP transporter substrate-binding protein n=1 Tax=Hydrogenophaga sp. TaxID=1904254 RepID=UPI00261DF0B2|nr:TRAP transporter substrate-binding protein [Hydrogenophaga sp.]MCV0438753.1 TRAP transporter substrate-binding protein [Hydrogenophaga sp.]